MSSDVLDPIAWVLDTTGASAVENITTIQSLWGGYGELLRLVLREAEHSSVILKRVLYPSRALGSVSDRRKRGSYEVEQAWYRHSAYRCDESCRVARWLAAEACDDGSLLLLEDLATAGYRAARPGLFEQLASGLRWLANFHALFLGQTVPGLWSQGSYWHLATRQQEWEQMPAGPFKDAAERLDLTLRHARYSTLLHGDAKPANFCWQGGTRAAAVDFQYAGPGCGVRDAAYYLDSLLGEQGCQEQAERWLDVYFRELSTALTRHGKEPLAEPVEAEWRQLFPVAWSDFQRFYLGWSRHSNVGDYSRHQLQAALAVVRVKEQDGFAP